MREPVAVAQEAFAVIRDAMLSTGPRSTRPGGAPRDGGTGLPAGTSWEEPGDHSPPCTPIRVMQITFDKRSRARDAIHLGHGHRRRRSHCRLGAATVRTIFRRYLDLGGSLDRGPRPTRAARHPLRPGNFRHVRRSGSAVERISAYRRDRLRGWGDRTRTLMCEEKIHLFDKSPELGFA
jgi:hypothetical protein